MNNFENENDDDIKLEKGDLLAMILAVFSILAPFVIAMFVIITAVILILF